MSQFPRQSRFDRRAPAAVGFHQREPEQGYHPQFDPSEPVCAAGTGRESAPLDECMNSGRGIKVFSQWDDGSQVPVPGPFVARRLVQYEPKGSQWVTAQAFAFEAERVSTPALSALSRSQIQSDGAQSSRLRWRLSWGGAGGGQFRDIDIGFGSVVSVYTCSTVTVDALVPDSNFVGEANQDGQTFTGRVLDTLLGVDLGPSDGPVGLNAATLTDAIRGDAANLVPVPPGARTVAVSATRALTFDWNAGAADRFGVAAILSSITLPASQYILVDVPALARFLSLPGGGAATDVTILRWGLDV